MLNYLLLLSCFFVRAHGIYGYQYTKTSKIDEVQFFDIRQEINGAGLLALIMPEDRELQQHFHILLQVEEVVSKKKRDKLLHVDDFIGLESNGSVRIELTSPYFGSDKKYVNNPGQILWIREHFSNCADAIARITIQKDADPIVEGINDEFIVFNQNEYDKFIQTKSNLAKHFTSLNLELIDGSRVTVYYYNVGDRNWYYILNKEAIDVQAKDILKELEDKKEALAYAITPAGYPNSNDRSIVWFKPTAEDNSLQLGYFDKNNSFVLVLSDSDDRYKIFDEDSLNEEIFGKSWLQIFEEKQIELQPFSIQWGDQVLNRLLFKGNLHDLESKVHEEYIKFKFDKLSSGEVNCAVFTSSDIFHAREMDGELKDIFDIYYLGSSDSVIFTKQGWPKEDAFIPQYSITPGYRNCFDSISAIAIERFGADYTASPVNQEYLEKTLRGLPQASYFEWVIMSIDQLNALEFTEKVQEDRANKNKINLGEIFIEKNKQIFENMGINATVLREFGSTGKEVGSNVIFFEKLDKRFPSQS